MPDSTDPSPTVYHQEDGITIYHGRCEKVLPHLSAEVDLVVTSPPYNHFYRVVAL